MRLLTHAAANFVKAGELIRVDLIFGMNLLPSSYFYLTLGTVNSAVIVKTGLLFSVQVAELRSHESTIRCLQDLDQPQDFTALCKCWSDIGFTNE